MNAATVELQTKIHRAIPLSRAMGCRIARLTDRQITVEAPLGPNLNIHGSAFAGSLYALGILAAWGLGTHIIESAGLEAELVVAEARIGYLVPVRGKIACRCAVGAAAVQAFLAELDLRGRSRLALEVTIGREPAVSMEALMHARLR